MNHYLLVLAGLLVLVGLAALRARLDRREGARRVFDFFWRLEIGTVVLLVASLVVLGTIQVVMRNLMHSGLLWADPFMRHVVLYLGAIGATVASARMNHITVDVVSRVLPARLKPARRAVIYGATAIASAPNTANSGMPVSASSARRMPSSAIMRRRTPLRRARARGRWRATCGR